MDPLVQKGIDCKWLFDTEQEAYEALEKASHQSHFYDVTVDDRTRESFDWDFCSGRSYTVERMGDKYQASVLLYVNSLFESMDDEVKPGNPFGIPLTFEQTSRAGFDWEDFL